MTIQTDMNDVLSDLNIDGSCVHAEQHRHLAFYDIKLARSVDPAKLTRKANQIALAIRSHTIPLMRIVPDQGIVRVHVAMSKAQPVSLIDLFHGETTPANVLPMLLGVNDEGHKLWMDMHDNPHLLIAGATGSGKSTLLHTIIANCFVLHKVRYRNVHIYLNDPKRVEFQEYHSPSLVDNNCNMNGLRPAIKEIATSYVETISQLAHLLSMMDVRLNDMRSLGMRSIEENPKYFPLIMCIIDEVSDLMLQDKGRKLETLLIKLAQKGRAAGIFMVLATQRPSVDVLTGLIKANFPGRIACKTASRKDSEVILDRSGAETLLGRGDAVLKNMRCDGVRFQVAYTTPQIAISCLSTIRVVI